MSPKTLRHPVLDALSDHPPEVRFQWLLGWFVSEMVDLDYLLADCVAAVLGDDNSFAVDAWGESGARLKALASKAVEKESGLKRIVEQYEEVYLARNHLVHGLYDGSTPVSGDVTYTLTRLERCRKTGSRYGVKAWTFTLAELGEMTDVVVALRNRCSAIIDQCRRTRSADRDQRDPA